MKLDKNVKLIKDLNPNTIVLIKIGAFYHAYGKDAYLLSYLFGYQLKTLDGTLTTCGFPSAGLNKIKKELEDKEINYMKVLKRDNYAVEEDMSFKSNNKYSEYSDKAYRYIMKKKKIDSITSYLTDNINNDNFQEKILKIEEVLYGKD